MLGLAMLPNGFLVQIAPYQHVLVVMSIAAGIPAGVEGPITGVHLAVARFGNSVEALMSCRSSRFPAGRYPYLVTGAHRADANGRLAA